LGYQAQKLSDKGTIGLTDYRTNGLSEWVIKLTDYRTNGLMDYQTYHTIELSGLTDYWTNGLMG